MVLALAVSFLAGLLGAAISPRAQSAITHTPPPLASVTFAGTPTRSVAGQVAAISSGVIVVTTIYGQIFEVATKPGTPHEPPSAQVREPGGLDKAFAISPPIGK